MYPEIETKDAINHISNYSLRMATFIQTFMQETYGLGIVTPEGKDINNITTELDGQIHGNYLAELKRIWGASIYVIGEESKKRKRKISWPSLSRQEKMVASIDAVDGTDLVVKGLSNWCTALFIFVPSKRIVASFVAFPGVVYFASKYGVCKTHEVAEKTKDNLELKRRTQLLKIDSKNRVRSLRNASLCFYGQKAGNLLSIYRNAKFTGLLEYLESESEKNKKGSNPVKFRIYNLAGNPMMMKLIEGSVDVVLDLRGQKLYDVVPGAYIAQKAGAFWGNLEGNEIDEKYLSDNHLTDPENSKIKYIIASSEELYRETLKHI